MANQDIIEQGQKAPAEVRQLPVKFDAESLISKAIEHNLPVETMERLLAMRAQLKAEAAREAFFQALSAFQAECPVIKKGKAVHDKYGKLRYHYAPLDDIVRQVGPILKRHGFSYTIGSRFEREPYAILSTCTLHHEAGHEETSEFLAPIDRDAYMNEPQKFASASSFSKRYAFCNATGILTGDEDDDAQSAGAPDMPPFTPEYRSSRKPPAPKLISPAQHKRLEARINELGLDRERIKAWLSKATQGRVEHFQDMSQVHYEKLDAKLEEWAEQVPKAEADH